MCTTHEALVELEDGLVTHIINPQAASSADYTYESVRPEFDLEYIELNEDDFPDESLRPDAQFTNKINLI